MYRISILIYITLTLLIIPAQAVELSPLARQCLEQGRLTPLQKQMEQCNQLFEVKARRAAEYLYFLRGTTLANDEIMRLLDILNNAQPQIIQLHETAQSLYDFLDAYDGGDWEARFGATGFYDELMLMRSRLEWLDIIQHYYSVWGETFGNASAAASPQAISKLKLLGKQLQTVALGMKNEPLAETLLWQGRVHGLINYLQSSSETDADMLLQQASERTSSTNLLWSISYERARLALWHSKPDIVKKYLHQLDQLLIRQSDHLSQPTENRIFCALLQGELQNRSIAPLQQLLRDCPELRGEGQSILGFFLAHELIHVKDTVSWATQHKVYELEATATHLCKLNPPDWQRAAELYEARLGRVTDDSSGNMPDMLFQAGRCRYELIDLKRFDADDWENAQKAVHHWLKLACDYPDWRQSNAADPSNSLLVITKAADICLRLYTVQPEKYTDLAQNTLQALVGRLENKSPLPAGPFAQSDPAQKRRYYYAVLLKDKRDYIAAVNWFDMVSTDDEHINWARYLAIYCRQQASASLFLPASNEEMRQWIAELNQLADKVAPDAPDDLSQAIAFLMARIYHDLDEPVSGVAILQKTLSGQDSVLMAKEGTTFIAQLESYLWLLLREDRTDDLQDYLQIALPTCRDIYHILQKSPSSDYTVLATRLYLEYLALMNAYIRRLEWEAPQKQSLREELNKALTQVLQSSGAADSIWQLRVQGLAAYVRGDYPASLAAWQCIRASTHPDDESGNSWWLARVWSLRCLAAQDYDEELRHVIDVLRNSCDTLPAGWGEQINALYDNAL